MRSQPADLKRPLISQNLLAEAFFTSTVTIATTTQTQIVVAPAIWVPDAATKLLVELDVPLFAISSGALSDSGCVNLWAAIGGAAAADQGQVAEWDMQNASAEGIYTCNVRAPYEAGAPGLYQFSFRGYRTGSLATVQWQAGPGGAGGTRPGYIRVYRDLS